MQQNDRVSPTAISYHHGLNCWSPVINIMRHWAWGRNDETYGECPVLSGAFSRRRDCHLMAPPLYLY